MAHRSPTPPLSLLALLCCTAGCPESPDTSPSADLSLTFRVDPTANQTVAAGGSVTYQLTVESKGILNAGVEFAVVDPPPGITVIFSPTRLAETARQGQMIVQTSATMRPGDFDLAVRGRLSVGAQGAPEWHLPPFRPRLTVTGGVPSFDLDCSETMLTLRGGSTEYVHCRVRRDPGFGGTIEFSFSPRPSYLAFFPDPARLGPDGTDIVLTVQRAALVQTPPTLDLVLSANSPTAARQHTVRLELPSDAPTLAFRIVCTGELVILAGGSRTLACEIFRAAGYNEVINFSFGARPEYLTISPQTASAGPGQSRVEFNVGRSPGVQSAAFFDLEVIARAFPFEQRAPVRVHLPNQ